ncbi:MAG TPA: SIMPL domain-containing protein [Candidatus Binataceae bacterium]|jgi:uncharacterized protein YggE|nr:SIMPL domain-containing protein [Candidatus Binataceae bacterium]
MKIPALLIVLALIQPTLAIAQATPQSTPLPTIEVTGNAEVRANPDRAAIDIAVETHATNAAEAATDNAKLALKITEALKARLGDSGKIQTGSYNLMPDYSQKPGESSGQIIGYRAVNTVTVETTALDRVGPLIDAAIGAGANRIDSVTFTLRDQSGPRNDAIGKAAADAVSQARALAAALGVKLKRVLRASTTAEPRPIQFGMAAPRMMAAASAEAPTPISAGQITVPATVYLTYEIE